MTRCLVIALLAALASACGDTSSPAPVPQPDAALDAATESPDTDTTPDKDALAEDAVPPECTEDIDCDDGVACTLDFCTDSGECAAEPNHSLCSDSDVCTGQELCDLALGCQPGEPLLCDDGVDCTIDSCDPSSGCMAAADDSLCDDQDACTGAETCDASVGCQPGTPLTCDDGVACTVESCDSALGCVSTPDDTLCDDQDLCTGIESCDLTLGCQAGEALECDDGVDCTADACDALQGCVHSAEDAACDDGDVCTGQESCDTALGCQAGEALVCDDEVGCTLDSCDAELGCLHAPDDAACDDALVCTGSESCDVSDGCQPGVPPAGCCTSDESCDDGDVCNGVETCDMETRTCLLGEALACDDGVGCTADTCDPLAGCVYTPEDSACDDSVGCTLDSCDAVTGCLHAIDDTLCDDAIGCTLDSCDALAGCVNAADDAACDDADVCTGVESCDAELGCQPGEALDCDDSVGCTVDSCDALAGCDNVPDDALCDDGLLCTGVESCDLIADCQQGEAPQNCCVADSDCDDGLLCTGLELCNEGDNTCLEASAPDCDDGEVCTVDSCSEEAGPLGCLNTPALAEGITVEVIGVEDGGAYGQPVTVDVSVDGSFVLGWSATLDGEPLAPESVVESAGEHVVVVTVEGCGIEPVVETLSFFIDTTPPAIDYTLSPEPNAAGWNNAPVTVTFVALDELTSVAVSEPVVVSTPGAGQVVSGTATDAAGNVASVEVSLNLDFKSPSVTIESPVANQPGTDQLVTAAESVTFSGQLGDDTLSGFSYGRIVSSKHASASEFDAPGPYTQVVSLEEGVNTVTVSAHDIAGNASTASICVIRDSQPPHVFIQAPTDGHALAAESVDVSGLAHDLVVGEVTADEVSVTITVEPSGVVVDAVVEAGHFVVQGVPLSPGLNTLTATATDTVGQTAQHAVTVERASGEVARLEIVSGNFQTCVVGTQAAEALVVRLVDAEGAPVPGVEVAFAVTGSDGRLWADEHMMLASPNWRRCLMQTDAEGLARTHLTCGSRSGAGVDRVTASAQDVLGSVSWFATVTPAPAANIYLHAGDNQQGTIGEPLPIPLAVLVTDHDANPVEDMAVTFSVSKGDGKLGGQSSVVVMTNAKGIADVPFVLGQLEGYVTHEVLAQIPPVEGSTTASGVSFTASAFAPRDPDLTQVSGVIVDQDEAPLEGVTIRFPGLEAAYPVVTGADGTFTYSGAPAGFAKMILDGSTVPHEGQTPLYPTMTFEVHNVAGRNNRLDRPVFMLKLDDPVWVDGLSETVLTLDEAPGFALTIPAGTTLTFPDGSHEGWLSVTQVHFDQAPMAPSDGIASRMLVTIQPPGVHFDPPAPLQIPNADGYSPGRKVEMYSYDHDLEAFVTIGPGSVSEDATVIRSDPGVGVVKGGWHGGGNPDANSDSENISASLSTPSKASGPDPISIAGSGKPGPNTGWGFSVCDGSGGMSCSGTSCEGTLSGTSSRKVKMRLVHYFIDDPSQFAEDTAEVTICGQPPETDTIKVPGPLANAADVGYLLDIGQHMVGAAKELGSVLDFFGDACDSSGFDPKLSGEIELTSGCCGDCPTKEGTKTKGSVSLTSGSASFSCLFTHPTLLAVTGLVSIANTFIGESDEQNTGLAFEVGVKAEVGISASGSVGASVDTCSGSSSLSGDADVSLNGSIGGVVNIGLVGASLTAFVGGKASASGRVKVTTSPPQVCSAACWSGLEAEANINFDIGPFTVVKGKKTIPISCPGELFNSCSSFDWADAPPATCADAPCELAADPDFPTSPSSGGGSAMPSACPGGPASSVFGSCGDDGAEDQCQSNADCEDNRPCTEDSCSGGLCVNAPTNGCQINGSCIGEGATRDFGCKVCDPSANDSDWTINSGAACGAHACGVCDLQGECVPCPE